LCASDQPINCEGDHSVTIPAKFGSKWQNGFNEENNSRQRGRINIFILVGGKIKKRQIIRVKKMVNV
jgi:hypothetical protein